MKKCDKNRIESFVLQNKSFYVKRDDLLDPLLSGNKYWKLYALLQMPKNRYKRLASYGGTQSNAMLSIASLCHEKGWEFHYTCKPVSAHLKQQPNGNLREALDLGMILHEVTHVDYKACVQRLREEVDADSLFIPQGGADPIAQLGIQQLACEVKQWQENKAIEQLNVVIPSGTGTTAYYLAKALPACKVITTAVVGDKAYLISQMEMLEKVSEWPDNLIILEGAKKYQFAKPDIDLLEMYHSLLDAGIPFDLIYGTVMWQVLLQHHNVMEVTVLYIHSGGLLGNTSMLDRYKYQGMF